MGQPKGAALQVHAMQAGMHAVTSDLASRLHEQMLYLERLRWRSRQLGVQGWDL
jgi:hypothetical protein